MRFSLSSWKKSDSAAAAGGGSAATGGGGMRTRAMILVALLGAGAVGYKMFWPDSVPLKAAASAAMTLLRVPPWTTPGFTVTPTERSVNLTISRI